MDESARLLAKAFDDLDMHRRLLALLPWTVHCDHEQRRADERADTERTRALLLARIPDQRYAHRFIKPVSSRRCYPWAG